MLKKLLVLTCVLTVAAFAGTVYKTTVPSWLEAVPHGSASTDTDIQPVAGGNTVFFAEGEEAGTTTYDYQQNGAMGNRVAIDSDGNAHVCWMASDSDNFPGFPDRAVDYNFWDADVAEAFVFSGGVQASGVDRAGYTTGGVLSTGQAVVSFHQFTTDYHSAVAVDAAQGAGAFGAPVRCGGPTPSIIWPHIVIGADDVIHVTAHVWPEDPENPPPNVDYLYYCRSTDDGASFTEWTEITQDAGDDAAMAVSVDGSKVCVAWMSKAPVTGGGEDFACGHVWYRESTNSGQSWGTATQITDGRYAESIDNDPDLMWRFANNREIDCAYDDNDDIVIGFMEGWHTWNDGAYYYPRMWARPISWTDAAGFGAPTAYFPMFRAITEEGDTVWAFDSLGMWGVGTAVFEVHGGAYTPQLSIQGGNIVFAFGGQWDSLDLSGAGTVNGDIYATISSNGGADWQALKDWTDEDTGTVWTKVTNLTETPAYGAGVGVCMDEDYMTVWPWVGSDNILHISYVMDKFAGSVISSDKCPSYGVIWDNPFEYLRYPDVKVGYYKSGIDEDPVTEVALEVATINEGVVNFNIGHPVDGVIKIYDATGSLVESLEANSATVTWDADVSGIYFYSFVTPTATTNGKLVLID